MVYYLISCRSLTYAQRAKQILERTGITAQILRSPQSISGKGCGHAVRVAEHRLQDAVYALQKVSFPFFRVYRSMGDGTYQEVPV